jgi:LysM repeat protein
VATTAWEGLPLWEPEPGPEDELEDGVDQPDEPDEEDRLETEPRRDETTVTIPAARLAALPVRRRPRPLRPLRAIGSGEWEGAPPPARQPLIRRGPLGGHGRAVTAVTGLLVLALAVFVLPSLFLGGGQAGVSPTDGATAGATGAPSASPATDGSPPPGPSARPGTTPSDGPAASVGTPRPERTPQAYRVRRGDTLSGIAARFRVRIDLLECVNGIRDPDVLSVGQVLIIPPRGARCPTGSPSATPR